MFFISTPGSFSGDDSDMEAEHDYSEDGEYTYDREEEQMPETRKRPLALVTFISFLQVLCAYCFRFQLQLNMR